MQELPTFPDQANCVKTAIDENVRLAENTYRVRFRCPEIARTVLPGQFVMVRLAGCHDPLFGRPLAVYNVVDESIDVVYLVVGKMTSRLADLGPGTPVDVWGPLGNGFPTTPTRHLVMVAGGIGQTPFLTMAAEYLGLRQFGQPARECPKAERVTLCYGARSKDFLAGVDDFQKLGIYVRLATDDGSEGHAGLVTDLIEPAVTEFGSTESTRIVTCGPEPMLQAVVEVARRLELPCQVSLETPMACGMGICFSCVTKVLDADGNWDYRRTCVDGPVFDGHRVVFD
ncbi:MAG: dihydroorotate dehydrogenase electron transfer subunit [Planctomycetia bacterium]|jgi:dihydroorotate dehydrogenase electron transfer subunit